eukprot:TRINITY_DN66042_c11_g1_i4.p1 TRINITY_DN66042_c11_g1~~TRINITY_DN66042_c11_g1_i4.p1  ORF type:complete len:669 (+),score=-51.18 TRINITY_DN66042_c11_g1_i4:110-2116(+)
MSTSSAVGEIKVWVKEFGTEAAAFRVSVSKNAIVDDLKDAIALKMKLDVAAPVLKIKIKKDAETTTNENEYEEVKKMRTLVTEISDKNPEDNPIYYSLPLSTNSSGNISGGNSEDDYPKMNKVDISTADQVAMSDLGTKWVVNNINLSGLSMVEDKTVYVRKACKEMWTTLEDLEKTDILLIRGVPGVGKSTELFGWCMFKAKEKNVWWIHSGCEKITMINLKKGEQYILNINLLPLKICNVIANAVNADSIVVVDGFTKDFASVFRGVLAIKDIYVIGCTSFSAISHFNTGNITDALKTKGSKFCNFTMDSWTYEEYCAAYNLGGILPDNITDEVVLRERYFYAGGCIRFLIDYSIVDVIGMLDASFDKVSNYYDLLKGISGDCTKDSVNTIMQFHKNKSSPLSEYILRKLAVIVNLEFIKSAKTYLRDNKVFQGWIYELEILIRFQKNNFINFNESPNWRYGEGAKFFYFNSEDDINLNNLDKDTWLIPNKFNFGCVDMIYYRDIGKVDLVQVTCAKSHLYKLKCIKDIIEKLAVHDDKKNSIPQCKVTLYVIIPQENSERFIVKDAHFMNKHLISNLDKRWKSSFQSGGFFIKLWMKKDDSNHTTSSSSTAVNDNANSTNNNTISYNNNNNNNNQIKEKRKMNYVIDNNNVDENNTKVKKLKKRI